jgi:hypothetical protein
LSGRKGKSKGVESKVLTSVTARPMHSSEGGSSVHMHPKEAKRRIIVTISNSVVVASPSFRTIDTVMMRMPSPYYYCC